MPGGLSGPGLESQYCTQQGRFGPDSSPTNWFPLLRRVRVFSLRVLTCLDDRRPSATTPPVGTPDPRGRQRVRDWSSNHHYIRAKYWCPWYNCTVRQGGTMSDTQGPDQFRTKLSTASTILGLVLFAALCISLCIRQYSVATNGRHWPWSSGRWDPRRSVERHFSKLVALKCVLWSLIYYNAHNLSFTLTFRRGRATDDRHRWPCKDFEDTSYVGCLRENGRTAET